MGVFENPNPNKPLLRRGDRASAHPQEQHPHGQRRSCAKSLPEMHAVVVLPTRPAHRLLQLSYNGRHGDRAGMPGWAVSGFYGYLKGVANDLALRHVPRVKPRRDTLAGPLGRRGDQARARPVPEGFRVSRHQSMAPQHTRRAAGAPQRPGAHRSLCQGVWLGMSGAHWEHGQGVNGVM